MGLRDDLARWLLSKGIDQWRPGEIPLERLARWVDRGTVRVLPEDGRLIAAVAVLDEDPVWPEDQIAAGYIHLLMVARSHAGRGLGASVLAAAERTIVDSSRTWARLDAVATNTRLIAWYLDRGYGRAGIATFGDAALHPTALLQKPLTTPR
jgi:ribosomal protein S18 acetylase RimI-like enzyme